MVPSWRLKHMHKVESVFCFDGEDMIHLQPSLFTSTLTSSSLFIKLYRRGEIDASTYVDATRRKRAERLAKVYFIYKSDVVKKNKKYKVEKKIKKSVVYYISICCFYEV